MEALAEAGARFIKLRPHPEMVSMLGSDERLGLFLDRYAFKQVADVTDPAEFAEFMEVVGDGYARPIGVFAMPESAFNS